MPPVHQEHLDRTSLDSHKAQNGVAAVRTEVGTFKVCGRKPFNCVVDGDTFWLEGVKIRVADIDTPEIRSPKCTAEKALGVRATRRFMELLNDGPFTLRSSNGGNRDRYGRLLRIVERDGQSLGSQLVDEGLAHEWAGRRLTWCGEAH
jgi:endonuclease YncB( thermonuclease family)